MCFKSILLRFCWEQFDKDQKREDDFAIKEKEMKAAPVSLIKNLLMFSSNVKTIMLCQSKDDRYYWTGYFHEIFIQMHQTENSFFYLSFRQAGAQERLKEELTEAKAKARRCSIGDVHFIRELFKQKLL